jgi:MFS family permease
MSEVFAVRAAGMYRYSVAGETPRRCAICDTPMSGLASSALATSMSSSVSFGGRPPVRPARRAAARPGIGGWLSEYHGWRSIFYVSLPMSGFIFLAVGLSLPEKRAEQNPPLAQCGRSIWW